MKISIEISGNFNFVHKILTNLSWSSPACHPIPENAKDCLLIRKTIHSYSMENLYPHSIPKSATTELTSPSGNKKFHSLLPC